MGNRYKLAKHALKAMRAAGLSETKIAEVEAGLRPKPKVIRLKKAWVRRIEELVAADGVAVVTRGKVFSQVGWKARLAGASHLKAGKDAAARARAANGAASATEAAAKPA